MEGLRNRGLPDETGNWELRNWEKSQKFMTGLQDEKFQHSLLNLYTVEQCARGLPTVEKLRAKCRDFLTMTYVNQRQPRVHAQTQQSTSNQMVSQQKIAQQATVVLPEQSSVTPQQWNQSQTPTYKQTTEDLRSEVRGQTDSMKREVMGAIRGVASKSHPSAKAIRSEDETSKASQQEAPKCCNFPFCANTCSRSTATNPKTTKRAENLEIPKLSQRKQLMVLECGMHQVTKELNVETSQSVVGLSVHDSYLKSLGQDTDRSMLVGALRAKQTVSVHVPVDVATKVVFVVIRTIAWVSLDEDMDDQICLGRNEISVRAINAVRLPREAELDADSTMVVEMQSEGIKTSLRGMLDTGAGHVRECLEANGRAISHTMDNSNQDGQ